MNRWRGVIEEYRKFLPVTDRTPVVTLGEGNTPLIRATRLARQVAPGIDLYLKFEGMNPTGSFKDRGMTMAISKAVESGAKAVICASTGNTSASAAAYGARAGLAVYVLIPAGKIAMGKLSQAMMHQATVIQIEGNFDQALTIVKELSATYHIELVNSINPYRIEGQKTAAMEVCDELGDAPTVHVLPVGNAGNITAYWKGIRNTVQPINPRGCLEWSDFRRPAPRPLCSDTSWNIRRRWPRRSGSAIRPAGKRR
jgi:threonine synthase